MGRFILILLFRTQSKLLLNKCHKNFLSQSLHCTTVTFSFLFQLRLLQSSPRQPSIRDILRLVNPTKWYRLGLELHIDDITLQTIQYDTRGDCRESLKRMVQEWFQSCEKPTWRKLIDGLRAIGEVVTAQNIQDKFC